MNRSKQRRICVFTGSRGQPCPRDRSSRRHSNAYLRALARNELVDVAQVLEGSRQVLLETVGNVPWSGRSRISITPPPRIPGASPGPWGKITVTVVSTPTSVGVTGGVSACRQVATRLGGFLEVEQHEDLLTLSVYLPPDRRLEVGLGSFASQVLGLRAFEPRVHVRALIGDLSKHLDDESQTCVGMVDLGILAFRDMSVLSAFRRVMIPTLNCLNFLDPIMGHGIFENPWMLQCTNLA